MKATPGSSDRSKTGKQEGEEERREERMEERREKDALHPKMPRLVEYCLQTHVPLKSSGIKTITFP